MCCGCEDTSDAGFSPNVEAFLDFQAGSASLLSSGTLCVAECRSELHLTHVGKHKL